MSFLQNLQDCKYNCLRAERPQDELETRTKPFVPKDSYEEDSFPSQEGEDDAGPMVDGRLLEILFGSGFNEAQHQPSADGPPAKLSFLPLRNRGIGKSGFNHVPSPKPRTQAERRPFLRTTPLGGDGNSNSNSNDTSQEAPRKRIIYERAELVRVMLSNREVRDHKDLLKNKTFKAPDASCRAICIWGFECFILQQIFAIPHFFVGKHHTN